MAGLPEDLKKGKPFICPVCSSDDVDEINQIGNGDYMIGQCICSDCDTQFEQYFVYAGYVIVDYKEVCITEGLPENLKKGKPFICPVCGSDDIDEINQIDNGDYIIGQCTCFNCDAEYENYFVYAGYVIVDNSEVYITEGLPENLKKGNPLICPVCGSDDVDEINQIGNGDYMIGQCICFNCDTQFEKYFIYAGYMIVDYKEICITEGLPDNLKKGNPLICPVCGSDDIDEINQIDNGDYMIGQCDCFNCDAEYENYFVYAGYMIVDNSDTN